jgi:uncharacterized membrane protein YczE
MDMTSRRLALAIAWIGVLFFLATGIWALASPHSFFTTLALYPPYTRHLFHDIGAFQLGIAAGLLAGIAGRGGLAVGLWGATVGSILHAYSHWIDRDLGGRSSDPVLLTLLAALLVAGLIAAERKEVAPR